MAVLNLKVGGMSCGGCVNSVKRLLTALDGVYAVEVDLAQGQVTVDYDAARVEAEVMRRAIEDGGYQVLGEA